MADESVTPPGASYQVASDHVDGIEYQRIKLSQGEDGSHDPVTKTDGLPVQGSARQITGNTITTLDSDYDSSTSSVLLIPSTDVMGMSHVVVQLTETSPIYVTGGDPEDDQISPLYYPQGSLDGINWANVGAYTVSNGTSYQSAEIGPGYLFTIPVAFRYFRVLVSTNPIVI